MEFKMTGCVRWEGTDRGGEEGREGADYAGGGDHKIWIFKKKFLSSDHPISGEEEGDAEADGQEEEVGAEGQQQPGVEEQEEEEGDGGGDRVEGGGEDDGRAGEVGAAGEEARVQGLQFRCLDFLRS